MIWAFAFANFAIGMGAFVVVAVLSPIAGSLGMSKAEAGLVMAIYALSYAILSPLLVSLTGRIDRRSVLIAGLSIFVASAVIAALSQSAPLLYVARVLGAAGAGIVTPVAASVAFSVASPEERGRALSRVFAGMTLAQAFGLPVGGFLGYTFGWQSVFVVVAVLSAISLALVVALVPRKVEAQASSLRTLGAALADWRSMLSVLVTASFTGAAYVVYTYVAPLLEQTMGFGRDGITLMLLVYGLGAVAGNWAAGFITDRFGPFRSLLTLAIALALITPVYSLLPIPLPVLVLIGLLTALFGWAFMVPQQARLIRQTPQRQSVVLSLNAAAIYVGASAGSGIGSLVVAGYGLEALGFASTLCWLLALLHLVLSERLAPAQSAVASSAVGASAASR
jgi:MFS transporter, DHA1 family, inner membrane transport protein